MAKILKCPVCSSDINISSVVAHYSYRGFLPLEQGIRCRKCDNVLDIVQYKVGLFCVGLVALMFGVMSLGFRFDVVARLDALLDAEVGALILTIAIMGPMAFLYLRSFDWFTELRLAEPGDRVRPDDEIWTDPDDTDPDFVQYVAEEMKISGHEIDTGVDHRSDDWTCTKCGEENNKELNLCWNCGVSPGPEDS